MTVLLLALACSGDPAPVGSTSGEVPVPEAAPPQAEAAAPSRPMAPAPWPTAAPTVPERTTASPLAAPSDERVAHAREVLLGVVEAHARDATNPWGIAHALVAMGPTVVLTDERKGVDAVYADFGELVAVGSAHGVRFPRSKGESRVEPHTDLWLKAVVEADVSPERTVTVAGQALPVAEHWRASLRRTWVDGRKTSGDSFNDMAWTLRGLAGWAPAGLAWTAEGGHEMTLDALVDALVDEQHRLNAELRQAAGAGAPVQKRGQGIWTHTCGGAHTLQSNAYAVARGFGSDTSRAKVLEDVPVLLYRLDLELAQVDRALAARPEYGALLIEQRLKFLGHFLETAHTLAALGLLEDSPEHRAVLAKAREELLKTVEGLERANLFPRLGELEEPQEQLYLDYVGDAAHAVHGLDLSTGDATVRW